MNAKNSSTHVIDVDGESVTLEMPVVFVQNTKKTKKMQNCTNETQTWGMKGNVEFPIPDPRFTHQPWVSIFDLQVDLVDEFVERLGLQRLEVFGREHVLREDFFQVERLLVANLLQLAFPAIAVRVHVRRRLLRAFGIQPHLRTPLGGARAVDAGDHRVTLLKDRKSIFCAKEAFCSLLFLKLRVGLVSPGLEKYKN